VGLVLAFLGTGVDVLLGIPGFRSHLTIAAALLLLTIGFLLRVWATFYFYKQHLRVISLVPQKTLITSGPYRFSRNPLYLGGNVCIFFGASLLFGSPTALFITVIHIPLTRIFDLKGEHTGR
jgi:protein-S-isoprenylcysteine O-methyltransferase Ste14